MMLGAEARDRCVCNWPQRDLETSEIVIHHELFMAELLLARIQQLIGTYFGF